MHTAPICADYEDHSEKSTFFRILTHDDRSSHYIVAKLSKGVWREAAYRSDALKCVPMCQGVDSYATVNGFSGKRRRAEGVRQLNALFYDFDCHGVDADDAPRLIEAVTDRLADAFNSRFKQPLPKGEIENIVREVDSVVNIRGEIGHYVLSAETLVRLLSLTKQEIEETHFFASKRLVEHMEAKRRTREKRDARNDRILELFRLGRMTQEEIAAEAGCSVRTAYSVLREAGLTRHRARPKVKSQAVEVAKQPRRVVALPISHAAQSTLDVAGILHDSKTYLPDAKFGNFMSNVSSVVLSSKPYLIRNPASPPWRVLFEPENRNQPQTKGARSRAVYRNASSSVAWCVALQPRQLCKVRLIFRKH